MGRYQPLGGRAGVLALFAVSTAITLVVVALDATHGRLSWWFHGYLVLSLPWNGYWWLVRLTTSLTVADEGVGWETPLRSGRVRAGALLAVRSVRWIPGVVAIHRVAGPSVLVLPQKGFTACAAAIGARFPHVEVALRSDAGWGDRLPGRSAWTERAVPPPPVPATAGAAAWATSSTAAGSGPRR